MFPYFFRAPVFKVRSDPDPIYTSRFKITPIFNCLQIFNEQRFKYINYIDYQKEEVKGKFHHVAELGWIWIRVLFQRSDPVFTPRPYSDKGQLHPDHGTYIRW